ncbi:MAG: endonuclease domain-containing protein [Caulobacteraceae bacterium]
MRAPAVTVGRARELRRSMTAPEVLLWALLRGGKLGGLRFRRQHPVGPFILDFFCPTKRLAIEVDGEGHRVGDQREREDRRDQWLIERNIVVMRFAAMDVLENPDGVLTRISDAISAHARGEPLAPSTPSGSPSPAGGGG